MPARSIGNQLGFISFLFLFFIALVIFLFYYGHSKQAEELVRLRASHKIIGDYLNLEEAESAIIERVRSVAEGARQNPSDLEIAEIKNSISEWFKQIQLWRQDLKIWQADFSSPSDATVFSPAFISLKQRQADAYNKALALCREGKLKDASSIINIEKSFRPSVHKSITSILDGIKFQMESDSAITRRFYIGASIAMLGALLILILSSAGIFRIITVNLKTLEEGARRIAKGDFSKIIGIKSPSELASLATAFNEMQSAVKSRDERIIEDHAEIKKLNESLEKKVVERNKTILQQNIALKRKNEELEQVLYAASHDLRTPLIGIQGFSEELKASCSSLINILKQPASPDSQKTVDELVSGDIDLALRHIINGSKRMEILLEGLLRISRMGRESLQIQQLNMDELVRNVATSFDYQIKELGASLSISKLDPCMADPSQFEQVFTNLISNAIKYRDPSRKLSISVSSEKGSDFTRYRVQDNGIGIKDEHRDRVFHAFFRVDPDSIEGDGVGLAIVNRALDLHGGRAWVEAASPNGSQFIVELPNSNFQSPK